MAKVPATTLRLSPSRSVSLASSWMAELNGTSSVTAMLSLTATGASLAGLTVIVRVPTSVRLPSVTV
ncbi:hypothetical protein D3C78_1980370 [compost metagenome]